MSESNATPIPAMQSQWPPLLFDPGSFVELGRLAKDAGVTTGYGTVNERLVFAYGQHGPVNLAHAAKISNMYNTALKMGAPVVGFLDAPGLKLTDGLDMMEAIGRILAAQSHAKHVIPQICAVIGDCMGVSSLMASLSDFSFLMQGKGKTFLQSPNTYAPGQQGTAQRSDFCLPDEDAMRAAIRELIGYLPSNCLEDTVPKLPPSDLNSTDPALNHMASREGAADYAIRDVVASIADHNDYLEVREGDGAPALTAFGRFNGYTAGILAVQGALTTQALEKAYDFVEFCGKFFIPIVTLTDVCGYEGTEADDYALRRSAAALARLFAQAAVPKLNIILRHGIGSPYLILNSKHLGADITYAWPDAMISVMEPAAADKVMKMAIEATPYEAGALGYVDDVIEPAETRKRIIASLEMLSSKRGRV